MRAYDPAEIAERVSVLVAPGEAVQACAPFQYELGGDSHGPGTGRDYHERLGLDVTANLSYRERMLAGYIVVSGARLLLTKQSTWRARVKPKYVRFDEPLDACTIHWGDVHATHVGTRRIFHVFGGDGKFASGWMVVTHPFGWKLERGGDPAVVADAVIVALGPRAVQVDDPER